MDRYVISLVNEKLRFYIRFSWLLILFFFVLYCYLLFFSSGQSFLWYKFIIPALCIFAIIISFYQSRTPVINLNYLLLAIGFLLTGHYYIATAIVLFGCLSIITRRPIEVVVDREEIEYPSFPKKEIVWQELNNLVLKDGLLTIDFKNNRLIQQKVDENKTKVNEAEFNEFCRANLVHKP